jgi:hypothetical protein
MMPLKTKWLAAAALIVAASLTFYWFRERPTFGRSADLSGTTRPAPSSKAGSGEEANPSTRSNAAILERLIDSPASKGAPNSEWSTSINAGNLEKSIVSLLRSDDRNAPILASHIARLCRHASVFASKDLLSQEALRGLSYKEHLKSVASDMTDAEVEGAIALQASLEKRCGKAGDVIFALDDFRAAYARSKAAETPFSKLPKELSGNFWQGLAPAQITTISDILREPRVAPVWLIDNYSTVLEAGKRSAYLDGLTPVETMATTWMAICNFGGECGTTGLARYEACYVSKLCFGESVYEAVAHRIPQDRLVVVAERANRYSLALISNGAELFKSLKLDNAAVQMTK